MLLRYPGMFRGFADLDELTLPEYEALLTYDPNDLGGDFVSQAEIAADKKRRKETTPRQRLEEARNGWRS